VLALKSITMPKASSATTQKNNRVLTTRMPENRP